MGRITNLLIGLVVIGFIMTSFIVYLADLGVNNDLVFNKNSYAGYNKINEINELSKDVVSTTNSSVEVSSTDILGSYFKQGYSAFRLTLKSGEITTAMVNNATGDLQLEGNNNFGFMITTIIALFVIFGVIIYVVVGKDV